MDKEQKKIEINKKFETKKINFLNTLFNQIDALRVDLKDLNEQYKEIDNQVNTNKQTKKK